MLTPEGLKKLYDLMLEKRRQITYLALRLQEYQGEYSKAQNDLDELYGRLHRSVDEAADQVERRKP
jgi:hypothetical protein